ncbi:hypothetical protein GALMADRAFT_232799 [Galerina marginata CBS 339.88]|uniref:Aminoglycoside phosphotransferase domain-containing protein n=1 Tax=Galerina marginata (strain CBS 339.88) TaxID=685588 RepID=A0A067S520_GALM3|nr:hypothetical protein GALMADRAFT_232799 [Galerina marginata CBS 339.88]
MSSLSPSDQEAISQLCEQHNAARRFGPYSHRCVEFGPWFVKYDTHEIIESAYKTQEYLFNQAMSDESAPRIPRVVAYFQMRGRAYLVSERIDAISPADTAPEAVAQAIQWLRRVPPPSGLTLGSVGGGFPGHRVFNDYEAPHRFSSVQALQNYMNRALLLIPPRGRPPAMHFLSDPVIFTQSNMDSRNFGLDTDERVCMFDFSDIGVLPESFASFSLRKGDDPFLSRVAEYLDWVDNHNHNAYSMARVSAALQMTSDPRLGLDMHGNRMTKPRR